MLCQFGAVRYKKHRVLDGIPLNFEFTSTESNTAWHQLALEGSWSGHWMGPFSLDEKILGQMVHYQTAKGIDTVVDYEHASIFADKAPAAGWIKNLEVRKLDDGQSTLWGQIDWTQTAAEHIKAKEYRFLSPTILFNTRDRKSGALTGASLQSVALTNRPFLTELPEVRLNSLGSAFSQYFEEEDSMNEAQYRALCETLGLAASATPDEVLSSCKKNHGLILSAEEMRKGIEQREKEIAEKEKSFAARDAADLVAAAQREGKVTADGTDLHKWAMDVALKNSDIFKSWVASAPKLVSMESPKPAHKETALTEEEDAARKAVGLTVEQWNKER